jgi:hypothetical protein
MSLLDWITHRMDLVGIGGVRELAERTGIELETCATLVEVGDMATLNWSQARAIAAALRVPIKAMRNLDDGTERWIEDDVVYDPDGHFRPPPVDDPEWHRVVEEREERRGTPVILRRRDGSTVLDVDDGWHPDYGAMIPAVIAPGRDICALELRPGGPWAIVLLVAPFEIRDDRAMVIFWMRDEFDGRCVFGDVRTGADKTTVKYPDCPDEMVDNERVVRAGRIVKLYPDDDPGRPPIEHIADVARRVAAGSARKNSSRSSSIVGA